MVSAGVVDGEEGEVLLVPREVLHVQQVLLCALELRLQLGLLTRRRGLQLALQGGLRTQKRTISGRFSLLPCASGCS